MGQVKNARRHADHLGLGSVLSILIGAATCAMLVNVPTVVMLLKQDSPGHRTDHPHHSHRH